MDKAEMYAAIARAFGGDEGEYEGSLTKEYNEYLKHVLIESLCDAAEVVVSEGFKIVDAEFCDRPSAFECEWTLGIADGEDGLLYGHINISIDDYGDPSFHGECDDRESDGLSSAAFFKAMFLMNEANDDLFAEGLADPNNKNGGS